MCGSKEHSDSLTRWVHERNGTKGSVYNSKGFLWWWQLMDVRDLFLHRAREERKSVWGNTNLYKVKHNLYILMHFKMGRSLSIFVFQVKAYEGGGGGHSGLFSWGICRCLFKSNQIVILTVPTKKSLEWYCFWKFSGKSIKIWYCLRLSRAVLSVEDVEFHPNSNLISLPTNQTKSFHYLINNV